MCLLLEGKNENERSDMEGVCIACESEREINPWTFYPWGIYSPRIRVQGSCTFNHDRSPVELGGRLALVDAVHLSR